MKSHRKLLTTLFKILLVVVLFYFLGKKGFLSFSHTSRAFLRWDLMLVVLLITFVNFSIGVIRWNWLIRAQGVVLSWRRVMELNLIGNFFNIALPGAVSGDVVKAYYVGREIKGPKGYVFGSILFDRIAGVSALVMVSAGALLFGFDHFQGTALFMGVRFVVLAAALGVIGFYAYLFLVRESFDPLLLLFKKLEARTEKMASLRRIYEGLRRYHDHRWVVLKVLAISVVIHLLVCYSCILFARALGEGSLPALAISVIVPLGLLVTAVPVLPGGIGTGHAAFGWLFHFLGTQRGADIFSLFVLYQFFMGGIGGLVYLRYKQTEPLPPVTPEE